MPNSFQVDVLSKDSNHMYLRLRGELNGSSAYQLLGMIKDKCNSIRKITLDTSALRNIHPFGLDLFLSNIKRLQNQGVKFLFIGKSKLAFEQDDIPN